MTKFAAARDPYIDLEHEDIRDSQGRRITQAYVDRAVEDAHRQLRGRPSLSAPGTRSPQISFRVPPELQAAAERRAAESGTSISKVAREALERYLAS